jgi:hypothetical protein
MPDVNRIGGKLHRCLARGQVEIHFLPRHSQEKRIEKRIATARQTAKFCRSNFYPNVPDIVFGDDDRAVFPTKYHGPVTLSKAKWDIICEAPERYYYRHNGEKVATTLINPDQIRHHQHNRDQLFYYKKFRMLMVNDQTGFDLKAGVYFAVVIDTSTTRICTVYPVEQPKAGKLFVPPKAK